MVANGGCRDWVCISSPSEDSDTRGSIAVHGGAARRMPLALGTPGKGNLRMDKGKKGKGVAREKRPATAHGTTNELLG